MPIAAAAATSPHAAPHHRLKPVLEVMLVWSVAIPPALREAPLRGSTEVHGHVTRRVQYAPVRTA
jgi:hypothetical protein